MGREMKKKLKQQAIDLEAEDDEDEFAYEEDNAGLSQTFPFLLRPIFSDDGPIDEKERLEIESEFKNYIIQADDEELGKVCFALLLHHPRLIQTQALPKSGKPIKGISLPRKVVPKPQVRF
jgi:hypothetical protein